MPVYKDESTKKWYFSTRYKDVYGNNKGNFRVALATIVHGRSDKAGF